MTNVIPKIDVAATVIYRGDEILTVYNNKWQAFTLPMTTLRTWQFGVDGNAARVEDWADAAMRNVGEWLGRTSPQTPEFLLKLDDLRQSDRSGEVKHYHFQVFGVGVGDHVLAPLASTQWLRADEIVDASRRPISPTARTLIRHLQAVARQNNKSFPPADHYIGRGMTMRQSLAAAALIRRERDGKTQWLTQWNKSWKGYYLVGGHKQLDESFRGCMVRELNEELGLTDGQDCRVPLEPRCHLEYVAWSQSAKQETVYVVELFEVELTHCETLPGTGQDRENRWLTEDEIIAGQTADRKPVTPTTHLILSKVGLLR